jgi:pimeloyl-ACP methyl ester carboxylesterase
VPYFTTKDACKIFYTTHGIETSKPIVIFLNGTTQTTLYWGGLVPAFSKHFGLLCYDARAQGQSDLGGQTISLQLHVSDLKELLVDLTIDKAHLVGISHGAWVALAFTAEFPEMVDRVVLCSLSTRTNDRSRTVVRSWLEILRLSGLKAMAWAALPTVFGNSFLNQHQKILDKIVDAVALRNQKISLMAQLDAVLQYPAPVDLIKNLPRRTLVVSGAEDPIIDSGDVRQLAGLCNACHEEIPGAGHSIPAEVPQIFAKMVLNFLTEGRTWAKGQQ